MFPQYTPELVSLQDPVPGTTFLYEDVVPDPSSLFEEDVVNRVAVEQALSHLSPRQRQLIEHMYLREELDWIEQDKVLMRFRGCWAMTHQQITDFRDEAVRRLRLMLYESVSPGT